MLTYPASEGHFSTAHHHRGDRIEQPLDTHPRPPAYELFWRGLPTAELCSTHKHTQPDIHQKADTMPTTLGLKWWGARLLMNLGFKPSASWLWVLYHLLHRCITLHSWYIYPSCIVTPTVNWGTLLKWAPHVAVVVVVVVVVTWCFTPSQPLQLYQGEAPHVLWKWY